MKFRTLIFGIIALVTSLTPQAATLSPKAMSLDDLKVEALPPDRGTVVFIAQTEGNPTPGVEIKIDGESRGFTGEDGKLKVEWLLFGEHTWGAMYEGNEVSQGEFEIEKIVDMDFVDFYLEREGKIVTGVYPFKDRISATWVFKNTGTTEVDHFTWKADSTPSAADLEIKLLRPKIPSAIFKFFESWIKEMFYTPMGREITFKGGEATYTNIFSQELQSFELKEPFEGEGKRIKVPPGFKGIKPGEIIKYTEERPYIEWVLENTDNKMSEMSMDVEMRMDAIDGENSVARAWIKEWKYGLFKIKNIEAIVQLKGPIKLMNQLFVDDKMCCSWEIEYEYLYRESIGGQTMEEILEKGKIEISPG